MISTSSKLEYCVQKTTIQRDVGLRIYYFAYMLCYSNYELKMDKLIVVEYVTDFIKYYSLVIYRSLS